ncbi:hypothetical protein H8959_012003 [Pygathrix nigripes]
MSHRWHTKRCEERFLESLGQPEGQKEAGLPLQQRKDAGLLQTSDNGYTPRIRSERWTCQGKASEASVPTISTTDAMRVWSLHGNVPRVSQADLWGLIEKKD